ncbi:hypothetical protein M2145_002528 [Lachnospiraceae bacterium PF1-21]
MNEQNRDITYININKKFVGRDIKKKDSEEKFHIVTLPKGTFIEGKDVGGYQFSPLFINDAYNYQTHAPDPQLPYVSIPLKSEKEVWISKKEVDNNNVKKTTVKVLPEEIKKALDNARKEYKERQEQGMKDKKQEQSR